MLELFSCPIKLKYCPFFSEWKMTENEIKINLFFHINRNCLNKKKKKIAKEKIFLFISFRLTFFTLDKNWLSKQAVIDATCLRASPFLINAN